MTVLWWVLPLVIGAWALGAWLHIVRERGRRLRGLGFWTADLAPLHGVTDAPAAASMPARTLKVDGVAVVPDAANAWWVRYRVRDTYVLGRHVRNADGVVGSQYFGLRRYLPIGALIVATCSACVTVVLFQSGAPSTWAAGFMLAGGHMLVFAAMRLLRGRVPTAAEARPRVLDAHARLLQVSSAPVDGRLR